MIVVIATWWFDGMKRGTKLKTLTLTLSRNKGGVSHTWPLKVSQSLDTLPAQIWETETN